MGVTLSAFETLQSIGEETITENSSDGRQIVTKRRNPLVAGLTITAVTCITLAYMDGGEGMISKTFGKVCVKCSK